MSVWPLKNCIETPKFSLSNWVHGVKRVWVAVLGIRIETIYKTRTPEKLSSSVKALHRVKFWKIPSTVKEFKPLLKRQKLRNFTSYRVEIITFINFFVFFNQSIVYSRTSRCDHLSSATSFPKYQKFPSKITVCETFCKRPPLISDRDRF